MGVGGIVLEALKARHVNAESFLALAVGGSRITCVSARGN